jgi:hypothetical protein
MTRKKMSKQYCFSSVFLYNSPVSQCLWLFLVFFFLRGPGEDIQGFELRASRLLGSLSTTWAMPLALFDLVIFGFFCFSFTVLGGSTLWHLQRILQCINYIILKFNPPLDLWNSFSSYHFCIYMHVYTFFAPYSLSYFLSPPPPPNLVIFVYRYFFFFWQYQGLNSGLHTC